MDKVRAKFQCNVVKDQPESETKFVELWAVTDGSEENKSFAKYTPSGIVHLNISYETQASDFFEVGQCYYLDFQKAE